MLPACRERRTSIGEIQFMGKSSRIVLRLLIGLTLLAVALQHAETICSAQQFSPSLYSGLHWRFIGPFRGGRSNAVTGVPGQPSTFYFGSGGRAGFGNLRTPGGPGRRFSMLSQWRRLAPSRWSPSNPERDLQTQVTGEADMRSQISYGNGVYKSTDAGKTWMHVGLDDTRQIGRFWSIREMRILFLWQRLDTLTAVMPNGECIGRTTAARLGKKCCSRTTTCWGDLDLAFSIPRFADRLCHALEYATATVEHLSSSLWAWERDIQIRGWRRQLATAFERTPDGTGGPNWNCCCSDKFKVALRHCGCERRRAVPLERWRRFLAENIRRSPNLGTRMVFLQCGCRSERRGNPVRVKHFALPLDGWRQELDGDKRRTRRRRLSPVVDLSGRSEADGSRERSGHDHQ